MARKRKKKIVSNKNNSIIFNTIPKSGSVYIAKTLQTGLSYSYMSISPGYFPHDNINPNLLKDFYYKGNYITQEHLDASTLNINLLKQYTNKIVVQFRDPRSVLLSWTHHMNQLNSEGHYHLLSYVTPEPPREYYSWELEQQIDWQIDNFLPNVVTWMNEWLYLKEQEAKNSLGFQVLITTYEDFHANELQFYYKILDFYGIPRNNFVFTPSLKNKNHHFRNGAIDEWKSVFTEKQLQRIDKIIPYDLLDMFDWEPAPVASKPILTTYTNKASSETIIVDDIQVFSNNSPRCDLG